MAHTRRMEFQVKRLSLIRLSISVVMLFIMTTFISNSESYAEHLSETLLTVDKSRGEWTLVVIPDTQSYKAAAL